MSTETQITDWLAGQQDAMVAMLREMVDTDSGSYNKPGIDAVGAVVQRFMAGLDIPVETLRQQKHGDCLRASVPWDGPAGSEARGATNAGSEARGATNAGSEARGATNAGSEARGATNAGSEARGATNAGSEARGATNAGSEARGATNAGGNIVLMGHRDTVFPDGEAERRPFTIRDGLAYGPGVADMKAGLVMNCFILAAFAKFGGSPAPLVGLFTGDEEIGSPEGRAVIETEARRARVVFNSEPGRLTGNVVTRRKGGVFMSFRVTGKAAHSGGNFQEGISAIEELARKIQAIHALTDLDRGITLNVGLISGGQSVNTVAPWAEGQIDMRYVTPEDRDDILAAITGIIRRSYVPGTSSELTIKGEFLPMTQSAAAKRLFELYVDAAADTGFKTEGEFAGGCADSGFTAGVGTPTICAVGPVGGKAHTPDEFLRLDSLVPRAQACARAILRLEKAGV